MSKTRTFLKESIREFKRVNWPTRRETMRYTLFVIGFSVSVALFLGFLDFVFSRVIERLV